VKPAAASNVAVRAARHSRGLVAFWWLQAIFNSQTPNASAVSNDTARSWCFCLNR
jgi:hypothetical protein